MTASQLDIYPLGGRFERHKRHAGCRSLDRRIDHPTSLGKPVCVPLPGAVNLMNPLKNELWQVRQTRPTHLARKPVRGEQAEDYGPDTNFYDDPCFPELGAGRHAPHELYDRCRSGHGFAGGDALAQAHLKIADF